MCNEAGRDAAETADAVTPAPIWKATTGSSIWRVRNVRMPLGTCALCLQSGDLRDSHLMPKAFYKMAKASGDKNPNPVIVNTNVTMKTSKQVSDYLLCANCEDRFNKGGESWVMLNCWRSNTDFPLHFALKGATPVYATADFAVYETAGVAGADSEKLAYFAMSVFWRAGVHQFGPVAGGKPMKLELGPYSEPMRKFLLGLAGFPDDVVLAVTVNTTLDTEKNEFMVFPWLKDHDSVKRQFSFIIPGITFQLFTGKAMPAAIRGLCIVRGVGHPIFMSPTMEQANHVNMAKLLAKSRPVGELRNGVK